MPSVGGFGTGLGSTVILAAWTDVEDSFSCRVKTRVGTTEACGCANLQLGDSALSTCSVLRVMKDVREARDDKLGPQGTQAAND